MNLAISATLHNFNFSKIIRRCYRPVGIVNGFLKVLLHNPMAPGESLEKQTILLRRSVFEA